MENNMIEILKGIRNQLERIADELIYQNEREENKIRSQNNKDNRSKLEREGRHAKQK